jgi:two-component system NtrC family sensor kinase
MDSKTPILIVDDESVVRETLCASLEGLSYHVRCAASGEEALAAMEQMPAHLVITDIMMPGMNGFQLLRHIREGHPSTVVVAVTGFGTVEDAVCAMKEGAFDYVTKPFAVEQVRLVVEKAVRHHQLQREKEQLEIQLRRSEELAFVGRLAAQVAHELNNPLDGALRFVNLTLQQVDKSSPVMEYQEEVRTGLLRMANIVHSLLEYSHSSSTISVHDDIHKIVRQAVAMCAIGDKVQVELDLAEDVEIICAGEISQVFINLIKNACDAMNNEGLLQIKTRLDEDSVYVHVSDTGDGIPEKHIEKIFFPFFTTKSAGKGTGLGLAISSDIVRRCGGQLSVDSRPGDGTTFTVRLPAGPTPTVAQRNNDA